MGWTGRSTKFFLVDFVFDLGFENFDLVDLDEDVFLSGAEGAMLFSDISLAVFSACASLLDAAIAARSDIEF